MLSFFIKFPAGQCLMMYDDRYWYMETHVSCMSLAVTSNLHIKQNKNLSKNWILSIVQSNDYVQFPLCYQKEKSGGKLGKAAQELSGLVGTLNLSQRAFLLKWAMNIDNKYPQFINVLWNFLWWNTIFIFKQSYCLHLRDLNSRWMYLIFTHNW